MAVIEQSTAPGAEDGIIRCPRCRVRAGQQWGDLVVAYGAGGIQPFADEALSDRPEVSGVGFRTAPAKWRSAHCSGCDRKTLWRDGENVYPVTSAAPPPHALMNPEVRDLYEEAGQVLPHSRRAGAALVRAALEKLLCELDDDAPASARLDDRIARISKRVSTPLAELLDVIRFLGNSSLHGDTDAELVVMYLDGESDADKIAELLFDAINDLIDELIARPAATQELWSKLPPGVQDTIRKKRAQESK